MIRKNIWNNNNQNITQFSINKKNFQFILEGKTTTDNQLILKFISQSPIILKLDGYQSDDDNINDSTYFKMLLDNDSYEYTTPYKNQVIDISKDININNNNFYIKNKNTSFYYLISCFSPSDIITSTNFKLTYQ